MNNMITKYELFNEGFDDNFKKFDFVISSHHIYMLLETPDKRNRAALVINIGRYNTYYKDIYLSILHDIDNEIPHEYILQTTMNPLTEEQIKLLIIEIGSNDIFFKRLDYLVDLRDTFKNFKKKQKSKSFNL